MLKKVIVLNNLHSNILSEAILVLKDDIELKENIKLEGQDIRIKSAIEEAQNIVEDCMYKLEQESLIKKNFFHKIIDKVKGNGNKF